MLFQSAVNDKISLETRENKNNEAVYLLETVFLHRDILD